MPRNEPHIIYRNSEGKRVPGTTTILGVLGKPAIIHWAWEQGMAGLDYRESRDQAADTGTLVHYLALCDLSGQAPDLNEWSQAEIDSTEVSMGKFKAWRSRHDIEPILLEKPLVSERWQFGGTPDFYGLIDGTRTLLDFKTGKRIYDEALYQTAAYKELIEEWEEKENNRCVITDVQVLRLGKEESDELEVMEVPDTSYYFQVFLHCLGIYDLQKTIRKLNKR